MQAYRKKALEFHPDKNPSRKGWAEAKFQQLSRALELLSDEAAKGAYDRLLKVTFIISIIISSIDRSYLSPPSPASLSIGHPVPSSSPIAISGVIIP